MKVRVKGSIDEVEVGQFRKNTKDSALKAYFSVITYSKDNEYLKAQKIRNCRYFEQ